MAVTGRDQLSGRTNYFIGNDPKRWRTNVANYAAAEYHGIYPGVDVVFHGDNRRLEFDFDVAPGADPSKAELEIEGSAKPRVNAQGNIVLGVADQTEVTLDKPTVYQEIAGQRREVAGNFVVRSGNRVGFSVGKYDRSQPLVIDPTLAYSTYLAGGIGGESQSYAIAVDSSSPGCASGCAIVTGSAANAGSATGTFPTTVGSYNPGSVPTIGGFPFIAKLKADGSGLVYATFFGGVTYKNASGNDASSDEILAIAADSSGAAYFGGISGVEDNAPTPPLTLMPTPTTPGSFMPVRPSNYPVPFVAKLSADGSTLVYSTFLDGSTRTSGDALLGIAVDSSGNAYVTGVTTAQDFPTTLGAFQTVNPAGLGYGVAFVAKLSPDGSSLAYSTYLGGSANEDIISSTFGNGAIAVDTSGSAYVTGSTSSADFPTKGAYIATCASPCGEAFVSKLNPGGTGLVYSTFLGGTRTTGNNFSYALGIAVDSSGSAFVGGKTTFTNFPVTSNAVQSSPGQGFITKLTPDGSGLVYSSYFNGFVDSVAVGSDDSAVIFGLSNTSLPFESTADAFVIPSCPSGGCFFDFISKLAPDGSSLIFSTPIGANQECCVAVGALDPAGNAYIAGSTSSLALPTTAGSFEPTLPSSYSGFAPFVAKVAFSSAAPAFATFSPSNSSYNLGNVYEGQSATQAITLSNTGNGPLMLNGVSFGLSTSPGFSFSDSCTVPVTLSPGSSCTVTVQFAPTTTLGLVNVSLVFADNAGPGQSTLASTTGNPYYQVVSLSGTGVAPPPSLTSITVTPPSPTITAGTTQQFTAMGTYSDGSAFTLTSVAWSSSKTSIATINASGLATGVAAGTSTIQATLGLITGSANLTVSASASGGGSCTCSASGFVAPNQGTASKNDPSTSPHGKYTVTATSTNLTVTRVKDGVKIINNLPFASGFAWGFSPDDDRLLVDTISGSQESVYVYDLVQNPSYNPVRSAGQPIGPAPVLQANIIDSNTPSRLVWSPSGTYLLFAALTAQNSVQLYLYNVLTHTTVASPSFTIQTPSSGSDKLGMAAWGFSPGTPEAAFLYDYVDSSGSASLNVINLDSGTTVYSQNEPSGTTWQFTACGDALQVTLLGQTPQLNSTLKPNTPILTASYNSCSAPNAVQSNFPVVVDPIDQTTGNAPTTPVTVMFSSMPASTQVSLTSFTTSSTNCPPTSSNFQFGTPPVCIDLTATPSFPSGASATICINFSATAFKNPSSVTLQHYVNGAWVNLTAVVIDAADDVLCVSGVTSFSPFALVEPVSAPTNPTVQLVTTLASSAPPTTDANGNYIVTLLVTNHGNVTAVGTELTASTLVSVVNGAARSTATYTTLPSYLGDIAPGASVAVPVSFPASAGAPGNAAAMRVGLTYSGGSAAGALRLTLP